ncbi:MAG: NADPH-dependent FMN reductase [Bauldia sp.]
MSKIGIIISSTRANRFADHPAKWIHELAAQRSNLELEVLDLRDYPMPFFEEVASPLWAPSKNEVALRWQKKIEEKDGYIVVTAEYNRGPTAAIKNAFDYAYPQWNKKPIAFVGYGATGGARAVEQLRTQAIELQMAPIRHGVHIQWAVMEPVMQGKQTLADFPFLTQTGNDMLDMFEWWVNALKAARSADQAQKAAA